MNGSRQRNAGSAEEATQGGAAQRDFAWVEASVWTERMLSALGNGVKGGKWFSLMDKVFAPKTLAAAWMKVRANKGAAGVDGQSIERFAAKAEDYLAELSAALREGSYRPQAVKRVDIPKGDGRTRPLGIPTVKDRIVQQAVRLVIEPIFETRFRDGSYGFRPGRGCHDALREVDRLIKDGYAHVVDADLASYSNSIPHDRLVARVEEKVSDGRVLDLIRGWLKADILKGLERWTPTRGSPQGAVISPLLANIFLDPLDAAMAERGRRMVRYADDFVILCRTREEADAALSEVARLGERKRPRAAPRKDACRVAVDHRQPLIGEIDPMAEVTASVRFGHGKINRRRTKTRAETQPRSRLPVARVAQPSMLGEDDLAQPAQLFGVRRFVAGARQANSDHGHFSGLPCAPASRWRREAG